MSNDSGLMAIVVMRELREELSEDSGQGDAASRIKAVHAAPTDSGPHALPGEQTFCGRPTDDMERMDYEPSGPQEWVPPDMESWACSECATAIRSA